MQMFIQLSSQQDLHNMQHSRAQYGGQVIVETKGHKKKKKRDRNQSHSVAVTGPGQAVQQTSSQLGVNSDLLQILKTQRKKKRKQIVLSPPIPQRLSESKLHRVTDEEDNIEDNIEIRDGSLEQVKQSGLVTIDYTNGSGSRFVKNLTGGKQQKQDPLMMERLARLKKREQIRNKQNTTATTITGGFGDTARQRDGLSEKMRDVHKVYLKRELNMFNRDDSKDNELGRSSAIDPNINKQASQATVAISLGHEQSSHQLFPIIKNQPGGADNQAYISTRHDDRGMNYMLSPLGLNQQPLIQRSQNIHDKLMIGNLIYKARRNEQMNRLAQHTMLSPSTLSQVGSVDENMMFSTLNNDSVAGEYPSHNMTLGQSPLIMTQYSLGSVENTRIPIMHDSIYSTRCSQAEAAMDVQARAASMTLPEFNTAQVKKEGNNDDIDNLRLTTLKAFPKSPLNLDMTTAKYRQSPKVLQHLLKEVNSVTEPRQRRNLSQYANFKFASQSLRDAHEPIVRKSKRKESEDVIKITMQKFNMAVEMANKRRLQNHQQMFLGTQAELSPATSSMSPTRKQKTTAAVDSKAPIQQLLNCSNTFTQLLNVSSPPGLPTIPMPLNSIISPKNIALINKRQSLERRSQSKSALEIQGEQKRMEVITVWEKEQREKYDKALELRRKKRGGMLMTEQQPSTVQENGSNHVTDDSVINHNQIGHHEDDVEAEGAHELLRIVQESSRPSLKSKVFGQSRNSGPVIWSADKNNLNKVNEYGSPSQSQFGGMSQGDANPASVVQATRSSNAAHLPTSSQQRDGTMLQSPLTDTTPNVPQPSQLQSPRYNPEQLGKWNTKGQEGELGDVSNSGSRGPLQDSTIVLPPNPIITQALSDEDTERTPGLSPMRNPLHINGNADQIQIDDEEKSNYSDSSQFKREQLIVSFKNLVKLLKQSKETNKFSQELADIRHIFANKTEKEIEELANKMMRALERQKLLKTQLEQRNRLTKITLQFDDHEKGTFGAMQSQTMLLKNRQNRQVSPEEYILANMSAGLSAGVSSSLMPVASRMDNQKQNDPPAGALTFTLPNHKQSKHIFDLQTRREKQIQELRAAAAVASVLLSHGANYLDSEHDHRVHTPGTERNERQSLEGDIDQAKKRIVEVHDSSGRRIISSPGAQSGAGDKSPSVIQSNLITDHASPRANERSQRLLQRLGTDFITNEGMKSRFPEKNRNSVAGLGGGPAAVTINCGQIIESHKDITLGYDLHHNSTKHLSKKDLKKPTPIDGGARDTDASGTDNEKQKVTVLQTTNNKPTPRATPGQMGVTGEFGSSDMTRLKNNRDMTATYYGGHVGTFDGRIPRDLTLVQYSNSLRSNSKDSLIEKRAIISSNHPPLTGKTSVIDGHVNFPGGPLSQLHLMQRLHHQFHSLHSFSESQMSAAQRAALADESLASIQNESQIRLTHTGLNGDMIKNIYRQGLNSPNQKPTYPLKFVDLKLDQDHALADVAALDTLNKLGLTFAEQQELMREIVPRGTFKTKLKNRFTHAMEQAKKQNDSKSPKRGSSNDKDKKGGGKLNCEIKGQQLRAHENQDERKKATMLQHNILLRFNEQSRTQGDADGQNNQRSRSRSGYSGAATPSNLTTTVADLPRNAKFPRGQSIFGASGKTNNLEGMQQQLAGGSDTAKLPRGLSGANKLRTDGRLMRPNINRSDPRLNDHMNDDDLNERVKMSQRNLLGPDITRQIIKDDEEDYSRPHMQDDQKTHTTAENAIEGQDPTDTVPDVHGIKVIKSRVEEYKTQNTPLANKLHAKDTLLGTATGPTHGKSSKRDSITISPMKTPINEANIERSTEHEIPEQVNTEMNESIKISQGIRSKGSKKSHAAVTKILEDKAEIRIKGNDPVAKSPAPAEWGQGTANSAFGFKAGSDLDNYDKGSQHVDK